jgi:hypothetical protein
MIEEIEMLEDIRDYDAAKQRIEDGEELVPGELTFAVLNGNHPVRAWRAHRQLPGKSI